MAGGITMTDSDKPKKPVNRVDAIVKVCALQGGVTTAELISKDRSDRTVRPRQVAAYLLRQEGLMLEQISRVLSRTTSTLTDSIQAVASALEFKRMNPKLRELHTAVVRELKETYDF